MFHDESWKSIHFGVKRSKIKVTSQKNVAGMGLCTPVSAGFFWLMSAAVRVSALKGKVTLKVI